MIHTLTLNPSLDYIAECPHFTLSATNRTTKEIILPGGKGINVSIVLDHLHHPSVTHGFTAGFTGDALTTLLKQTGLRTDMIPVRQGLTRINVKLKSETETELNGKGPIISSSDMEELMRHLNQLTEDDILVVSGSLPQGVPDDIYATILQNMAERNVTCIVDTFGSGLLQTLQYHPFLIKPNRAELQQLSDHPCNTEEELIEAALQLQKKGAMNVIVSLGKDGALLIDRDGSIYHAEAPSGTLVNSVGAGDSLVAGFLAAYLETEDTVYAFCYGVACGSASAFSSSFVTREEADELVQSIIPCRIR